MLPGRGRMAPVDAPDAALGQALAVAGIEPGKAVGPGRWRGRALQGPVLVTVVRPRSRVHAAALRARVDRLVELRHTGLAEVLGLVAAGDRLVVVQREVPGSDLATVLRGRPRWRSGEVLGIVADLAGALATLHGAGLAHGDVSPANVVVDDRGRAVLVDLVGGADPTEVGTPGWAAPERDRVLEPAVDLYSLGMIGRALLARCEASDAVAGAAEGAPEAAAPPRTEDGPGAALQMLLDRCVAAEAGDRPAAAEVVRAAASAGPVEPVRPVDASLMVGALLQEEAARGHDDDRTVRRARPVRRRHRRRGLARGVGLPVAVGLVAVAGTLIVILRPPASPVTVEAPRALAVSTLPAVPADGDAAERAAVGLTLRRATALATGNLPALLSVTEPGSTASSVDRALWRAGGLGPGDVAARSARVHEHAAGQWRVALRVRAGEQEQDVVLHLVRVDGRWLVRAVDA